MIALIGITIERKVTSSSRNASPNTKAKISGSLLFSWLAKSSELAASPLTLTVVPRRRPDRRRDDLVAELVQGVHGRGVGAVAGGGDVDLGDRAVLAVDDLGSGQERIGALDLGAQVGDAGGDRAGAHVVGLDDHGRGHALAREHLLDLCCRSGSRAGPAAGRRSRW